MPAAAGEKEPILLYGIGAQKAGTTWLFKQLERHPKVFLAQPKELHYWDCIRAPFNHAFRHRTDLEGLVLHAEERVHGTRGGMPLSDEQKHMAWQALAPCYSFLRTRFGDRVPASWLDLN